MSLCRPVTEKRWLHRRQGLHHTHGGAAKHDQRLRPLIIIQCDQRELQGPGNGSIKSVGCAQAPACRQACGFNRQGAFHFNFAYHSYTFSKPSSISPNVTNLTPNCPAASTVASVNPSRAKSA